MRADRVIASPRARRAARQRGIDLRALRGSGPDGRVVEADVSREPIPSPGDAMRRAIARRTSESAATIPHFFLRAELDATALVRVRQEIAPGIERAHGVKPSLTDFILRAMARALADVPAANRVWRDERALALPEAAIGLVVALDEGLAIPVLPPGDLPTTARSRIDAVARARAGKTTGEAPCAASLSNLGDSRVDDFSAIIPLGQSSILAVGRAAPRPWAEAGTLLVRTTLRLCLSADHRVLDGRPAADYLGRLVDLLECPSTLA
jgi:pyruvate dehydrogenase E2 component (dihydrolipoamide acetyltransferase)